MKYIIIIVAMLSLGCGAGGMFCGVEDMTPETDLHAKATSQNPAYDFNCNGAADSNDINTAAKAARNCEMPRRDCS